MDDKKTILYVDDEETNLLVFRFNFQKKFKVLTAVSGLHGLKILKDNPEISIVISDMKMPEMDGIQFLKLARNEFPDLICFLITGFDIIPEIEEAINSGLIQKYFCKPYSINKIEDSINTMI